MSSDQQIEAIRTILRGVALELAFVNVDEGGSVEALADPLDRLDVAARTAGAPDAMLTAVTSARSWIDDQATPDLGARLDGWHGWMEEALTAWQQRRELPSWPPGSTGAASPRPSLAAPATAPPGRPRAAGPRARWRAASEPGAGEPVVLLPADSDPDMMRLFCVEAEEILGEIERAAIALETHPDDAAVLATMFRGFHTLKGNTAVMRLVVLQRVAHEVESLLDAARRGTRGLDADAIDVVLAAADLFTHAVAEMTRQLDGHETGRSIALPVAALVTQVKKVLASPLSPTAPATEAVVSTDLPPEVPPVADHASPQAPSPAAETAAVTPIRAIGTAGSVRVDIGKLDGLIDLVGELVIAQSMVFQAAEHAGRNDQLARSLGQLGGITADLQRTAMAMRMVPVRGMFQKMARLVRDTAVSLGKDIRLVLAGEETEIDRTLIEELSDPLMHMIRNAVDHGIETPDTRRAAGKSPTGTIVLRAFHQGGHVVIQVGDDGRGLDPARLRRKAAERGLISDEACMDDREAYELIFSPGFSTADQITDVSGRGVGMDVVRRNLERIRGKIEIDSTPDKGTTFSISTPLTLAIIEGLIVAVSGQRFVIPTLSVRESFRPLAASVSTVHGRGELIDVRGRQLPLLRLGRHLGIDGCEQPDHGIVVVLEAGYERRGLLVDELLGKQEVVIKSLGETFTGRTDFAGAAILGDGRVGLILDTTALVRVGRRAAESAA